MRITTSIPVLLVTLAGCIQPPAGPARDWLDAPRPIGAVYPDLLTQPELAAALATPELTPDPAGEVSARVAALQARADALSGPVLTEAERRRLEEDVEEPA